jgi:hypothetical protein
MTVNATTTGSGTITRTYTWQRCTGTPGTCTPIPNSHDESHTVVDADLGFTIQVIVTAVNAFGPADSAATNVLGPVQQPTAPPTAPSLGTPTVSGVALVGAQLTAAVTASGNPAPALAYQWQRCTAAGASCADIDGARGQQYTLTAADAGSRIRVVVTADNGAGTDVGRSGTTDVVQGTVSGLGTGFDTTVSGPADTAPVTIGNRKHKPMSPFPQVRLRGKLLRSGARVTLFTVTAPRRSRIDVRCKGRGCPRKHYAVTAKTSKTRIRRYERFLRVGIHITVRVSRTGYVGKYSSFRIRRLLAPTRRDMCIYSATGKPVRCSS